MNYEKCNLKKWDCFQWLSLAMNYLYIILSTKELCYVKCWQENQPNIKEIAAANSGFNYYVKADYFKHYAVASCLLIESNPENMLKNPMYKSQIIDSHVFWGHGRELIHRELKSNIEISNFTLLSSHNFQK